MPYCDFQGRKSFRGISASSLLFQLLRSAVLLLYLHDQGSSWLLLAGLLKVKLSSPLMPHHASRVLLLLLLLLFLLLQDLCYDAWKISKILQPQVEWSGWRPVGVQWQRVTGRQTGPGSGQGEGSDQDPDKETEDTTARHDMVAVQHGWLALLPLLLGLPVYYLRFYKYKSW